METATSAKNVTCSWVKKTILCFRIVVKLDVKPCAHLLKTICARENGALHYFLFV